MFSVLEPVRFLMKSMRGIAGCGKQISREMITENRARNDYGDQELILFV
jgi:hypothetical protein